MAAVIAPVPSHNPRFPAPHVPAPHVPAPQGPGSARPRLRVIQGGGESNPARPAYWRRRLVAAALVVLVMAAAVVVAGRAMELAGGLIQADPPASNLVGGDAQLGAHAYVVQPGDTLWAIARRVQPEGDVRPVVDELASRLGGATIQPGQRLDLGSLAP